MHALEDADISRFPSEDESDEGVPISSSIRQHDERKQKKEKNKGKKRERGLRKNSHINRRGEREEIRKELRKQLQEGLLTQCTEKRR